MLKNSTDRELIKTADLSSSPLARELANRWARELERVEKSKKLLKQLTEVLK